MACRRGAGTLFARDLAADVESASGGSYGQFLANLVNCTRDETDGVDKVQPSITRLRGRALQPRARPKARRGVAPHRARQDLAEAQAKGLYEAGEKRWGTNEKYFIEIFSTVSAVRLASPFAGGRRCPFWSRCPPSLCQSPPSRPLSARRHKWRRSAASTASLAR